MAAVVAPRHPPLRPHQQSASSSSASSSHSPFRRVHRATYVPPGPGKSSASAAVSASNSTSQSRPHHSHHSTQPAPPPPSVDTYYGHEETSKLCARFVSHTFHCPETLPTPPSSNSGTVVSRSGTSVGPQPPQIPSTLAHFVAYALHRTRLHPSVVFTALALLHRLKSRFPAARGSSGHRLFLAAYMLASKVVCDDTYSNKSWAVVGQNMFALREINQMEREMLGYLEWSLNVPGEDLGRFEKEVRKVYGSGRDRESWGRGIEMRLTWGVGGAKQQEESTEESVSKVVPIATITTCPEKSSPHQLPTPTETGAAVIPVPIIRPVLAPITTNVPKAAYPSPPTSPRPIVPAHNAMADSDEGSSTSTSPVDGDSDQEESDGEEDSYSSHRRPRLVPDREGDGSPSPTSSEESAALPTPPNSALSAGPHHHHPSQSYSGYPQKMGKSHSVPGPGFAYPRDASGREHIGRSSAPPVAVSKREPAVSSVTASHFPAFTANVEEDGDAVMELDDVKHTGITYYTTPVSVQRRASSAAIPTASRASTSTAARKDLSSMRERERDRGREIKEGGRKERERSLRTYTVPCAW